MGMTQHTLKYMHKRRGFCKAEKIPETPEKAPEPACASYASPKITEDVVNDYIKQNPEIVSNCLRNERALEAQRKQMNARSLLTNAFLLFYCILYFLYRYNTRCRIRRKQFLVLFSSIN